MITLASLCDLFEDVWKGACTVKVGNQPIETIGVEYWYDSLYRYDGVSEWMRDGRRFGRWCEKELFGNEVEPPHCLGELHPQATMANDYRKEPTHVSG